MKRRPNVPLFVNRGARLSLGALAAVAVLGFAEGGLSAQTTGQDSGVTFAKDVAPILQENCQECHNPGGIGPMSLTTYEEARPFAPMIREKVSSREMPPWHLDRNIGIQEYKNDVSLTEAEIRTIVQWVDSGTPMGNPADMPPGIDWPSGEDWRLASPELLGRPPDLIIPSTAFDVPANGLDQWHTPVTKIEGLDGPRWVMANETKPSYPIGRKVTHHGNTSLRRIVDGEMQREGFTNFGIGKAFDIYPENTGRLVQPGDELSWNLHYYPVGLESKGEVSGVGLWFHPEDSPPELATGGDRSFGSYRSGDQEMVIPPHSRQITQGIHVLQSAARIHSFRVHQHLIGTGQSIEAAYPDGRVEVLGKAGWHPSWHITYIYEDHVAPLLPKGTVLIITAWYDNTANNPWNPDPDTWVVHGRRTGDEMSHMWVGISYYDEDQFAGLVTERERVLAEMGIETAGDDGG